MKRKIRIPKKHFYFFLVVVVMIFSGITILFLNATVFKERTNTQSSAAASCSGSCKDIYQYTCSTGFKQGLCPGGTNIQCCTGTAKQTSLAGPKSGQKDTECTSKKGKCYDVNTQKCAGVTHTFRDGYMCPGGNNIVCCVGSVNNGTSGGGDNSSGGNGNPSKGGSDPLSKDKGNTGGSGNNGSCTGTCVDINTYSCRAVAGKGGSFQTGKCPGAANIQCCVGEAVKVQPQQKRNNACAGKCYNANLFTCSAPDTSSKCSDASLSCCFPVGTVKVKLPIASVTAKFYGIDANQSIKDTTVPVQVKLYQDKKVSAVASGTLTYDPKSGNFVNKEFTLPDISDGAYQMIIHVDKYLDGQLLTSGNTTVFLVAKGSALSTATIQLIPGDVGPASEGDNQVTLIDWNLLAGCYGKAPTGSCKNADLNSDGKINDSDMLLLQVGMGKIGSSLEQPQMVCEQDPACKQGENGLQMCQLICTYKKLR